MTALYNEIEPYAVQWLRNLSAAGHIATGDVDARSIKDLAADDLVGRTQAHFFAGIGVWSYALRLAGWPDDAPVWTGSCPCQPFSVAGKGAGFADERHLWPVWFELLKRYRDLVGVSPTIFGEQVEGADGRAWLDLVSSDLEGIGYAFGAAILPAAGVGAPHIRHRTFFVAYADGGQRNRIADGEGRERDGASAGRVEGDRKPRGCGAAGGLADPHGSAGGQRRALDSRGDSRGDALARPGLGGGRGPGVALGDTIGAGLEGHGRPGGDADPEGREGSERHRPTAGFWRDAEWIFCRDGKYRPVEPGTFPLVDGSAFELGRGGPFAGKSRAGMLKAYGNGISPWAAAEFVAAAMESGVRP